MKLYEFEGNDLFRKEGILVPSYRLASTPEEAREKAEEIGLPVVIKAQILAGGRWVAGGVQTAESLEQVEEITRHILSTSIRHFQVHSVMVTKMVDVKREYYLGVTIDETAGKPIVILSTAGGVSVEEASKAHPEKVVSRYVSIVKGFPLTEAQRMAREVGLKGGDLMQVAGTLHTLYSIFQKYDALVAEINPLVQTPRGLYIAIDAKVEIDNSALFRHPELKLNMDDRNFNELERKGREIGVTYVEMNGDIGIISSGAGLGMATIDIVSKQYSPANFLETGGGISEELLYNVMDLVTQKEGLRAIFINVYGGINPIHEGAKGVVRYMKEHNMTIPVVAKALGNHQEETWEIFKQNGVHVVDDVSTEKGIELLAQVLEGSK
jgi:succinyl-CoA synthetase beta subunit